MLFSIFRSVPLYVKISKNNVEIINLDTGQSISKKALEPFSTNRFIIADFNKANVVISSIIKELIPNKYFLPQQRKILIQQVEPVEGGLSEIEKRALRDLGEMAAGNVILIDHFRPLSNTEALIEFKGK